MAPETKSGNGNATSSGGLDKNINIDGIVPADLCGIDGRIPQHQQQCRQQQRATCNRKAKRKRVSVLDDELSKLNDGDDESSIYTLQNIYEVAKLSHSSDRFFADFGEIRGIERVLDFLSSPRKQQQPQQSQQQHLGDPETLKTAANLAYLCTMRGPRSKDVSDAFVNHGGVEIFLRSNAIFVQRTNDDGDSDNNPIDVHNETEIDNLREELEETYKASSALWLALGLVFCKSGNLMTKEQHLVAIDAILENMDKLGDLTNQVRQRYDENNNRNNNNNTKTNIITKDDHGIDTENAYCAYLHAMSSKATLHANKILHEVYRALNYLIDYASLTREDIDSRRLFQRCHSIAKIPARTITTQITATKSQSRTIPERYKTDDATLFLNTKVFFVSCFQKNLLRTRAHFEEVVPLCVETILRNSAKASKNVRAQDRRHCVFDLMIASCQKVHKTNLEKSGILGAIEATLLAEGTVKSSSKTKARELLKAIVAAM